MGEAVRQVEDEVRELIRRSGLDPARHLREIDTLVREAVTDYDERSLIGGLPGLADLDEAVKAVLDTVAGFGPLQKYFDDPGVEEIWIYEPSQVSPQLKGLNAGVSPHPVRRSDEDGRGET